MRPFDRVDAAALAGLAGASGLDRIAATVSASADAAAAIRFVTLPIAGFNWSGVPVFVTPTDVIAIASAAVLLIRFIAWALSPLARFACGRGRR